MAMSTGAESGDVVAAAGSRMARASSTMVSKSIFLKTRGARRSNLTLCQLVAELSSVSFVKGRWVAAHTARMLGLFRRVSQRHDTTRHDERHDERGACRGDGRLGSSLLRFMPRMLGRRCPLPAPKRVDFVYRRQAFLQNGCPASPSGAILHPLSLLSHTLV